MVRALTLADVLEGLGAGRGMGLDHPVVPVVDSRKVEPGALFLAFPGERVDGHDFVGEAFSKGAVAAIVERPVSVPAQRIDLTGETRPDLTGVQGPIVIQVPSTLGALQQAARFWRQQLKPRVVGITGSVGKTTTKEVVARVLGRRYQVLHNTGSFNNEIGLPLTLLQLTDQCERAVLEMGMYVRGDIKMLAEMARPHIGIITNVEPVHAERAGSLEAIALGKQELVEALPAAPEGVAILNYDDPRVRAMAAATQARVFFYGLSSEADLWADEVESFGLDGIRVRLHYGKEKVHLRVPLLGQHSVHTVLRAAAAGLVDSLGWQEITEGLRSSNTQLRLVTVRGIHDALILDDTYNASPPSVLAALNLLHDLNGRKIAVLGDMFELGNYEEEGHRKVGVRAAGVVDVLVTVGSRAHWIAEEARLCGLRAEAIHEVESCEAAAPLLQSLVQADDIVLVKGSRGMHMEQLVAALSKEA